MPHCSSGLKACFAQMPHALFTLCVATSEAERLGEVEWKDERENLAFTHFIILSFLCVLQLCLPTLKLGINSVAPSLPQGASKRALRTTDSVCTKFVHSNRSCDCGNGMCGDWFVICPSLPLLLHSCRWTGRWWHSWCRIWNAWMSP